MIAVLRVEIKETPETSLEEDITSQYFDQAILNAGTDTYGPNKRKHDFHLEDSMTHVAYGLCVKDKCY